MNDSNRKQTRYSFRIIHYVKGHRASLGLFLAAYGAFYLSSVLLSGWSLTDWGKEIAGYPLSSINTLLPRSFINLIFFVTSFPSLIIGAAMLCLYSIRRIRLEDTDNKKYVAILLTAFGFTYQVIGAWPLGNMNDFPWEWQKHIVSNGSLVTWVLYVLSLIVLVVGGISLYLQSIIYHQKHLEASSVDKGLI